MYHTEEKILAEIIKMAIDKGKLCYLYKRSSGYIASFIYWDDWLFRAYPGGRKEFSKKGLELYNSLIK